MPRYSITGTSGDIGPFFNTLQGLTKVDEWVEFAKLKLGKSDLLKRNLK
ncbi:MAG: hypothetical protein M1429_03695 [Patescibacteria group bacterium]|nr:hypothetical protein [Patescibacteria group bacterium]